MALQASCAMQKTLTGGHLPGWWGKITPNPTSCCSPLNHRPGCSSPCYREHCRNVALPLECKCCQGVFWGRVCTSPSLTEVAVFLWMCLLLSYPAYSPSCFHCGEEGQAQPLLSTILYTGFSACGCSPGPATSLKAHLGLDVVCPAPHVTLLPRTVLLQHSPLLLPDAVPGTTVSWCLQQCRSGPRCPTNPGWGTCKHHSARGKPLLLNHPLHHRAASPR